MSQQSHRDDTIWGLIALAPIAIAATLGYAPWALGSVILARLVLLIFAISDTRPGLAARRAAGIFVMLLIPAGLHVYAFYPTFLRAWNPHHTILPLQAAWHLDALAHYPRCSSPSPPPAPHS